jgi:hypothetical protein
MHADPSAADPLAGLASSPAVSEAVEATREAVDRLRAHRVLRRQSEKVAAESALRGARASAALEGADLPLETLRGALQSGGELPGSSAPLVRGAVRVAGELGSLQETWRRAPLQALARLHTLAAADLTAPDALGRPQAGRGRADRLTALGVLLTSPSSAPAVVVAAVVHGELLVLDAFEGANGVVARAAARLVLVTGGLDPGGVSAPEVGHAELGRAAYADAAEGYRRGGAGLTQWLLHCAEAVVLGAREGLAICESIARTT